MPTKTLRQAYRRSRHASLILHVFLASLCRSMNRVDKTRCGSLPLRYLCISRHRARTLPKIVPIAIYFSIHGANVYISFSLKLDHSSRPKSDVTFGRRDARPQDSVRDIPPFFPVIMPGYSRRCRSSVLAFRCYLGVPPPCAGTRSADLSFRSKGRG